MGWLDRGSSVGYFLEVKTKNGRKMRLTGNHLIFIFNNGRQIAKYAKDLQPTDVLLSLNEEKIEKTEIASLDYVYSNGYRAPLTEEGTLLGKLMSVLQENSLFLKLTEFLLPVMPPSITGILIRW